MTIIKTANFDKIAKDKVSMLERVTTLKMIAKFLEIDTITLDVIEKNKAIITEDCFGKDTDELTKTISLDI